MDIILMGLAPPWSEAPTTLLPRPLGEGWGEGRGSRCACAHLNSVKKSRLRPGCCLQDRAPLAAHYVTK